MTQLELDKFEYENLAQQLFHVMSDDIDDETGKPLEEVILMRMLDANPEVLKHRPMSYWTKKYIGQCYLTDVKKENERIINKLKK